MTVPRESHTNGEQAHKRLRTGQQQTHEDASASVVAASPSSSSSSSAVGSPLSLASVAPPPARLTYLSPLTPEQQQAQQRDERLAFLERDNERLRRNNEELRRMLLQREQEEMERRGAISTARDMGLTNTPCAWCSWSASSPPTAPQKPPVALHGGVSSARIVLAPGVAPGVEAPSASERPSGSLGAGLEGMAAAQRAPLDEITSADASAVKHLDKDHRKSKIKRKSPASNGAATSPSKPSARSPRTAGTPQPHSIPPVAPELPGHSVFARPAIPAAVVAPLRHVDEEAEAAEEETIAAAPSARAEQPRSPSAASPEPHTTDAGAGSILSALAALSNAAFMAVASDEPRKGRGDAAPAPGRSPVVAAAAAIAATPAIPAATTTTTTRSRKQRDPGGSNGGKLSTAKSAAAAAYVTKARASKLPPDAVTTFRHWFRAHLHDPYPTDEEKAQLAEETGLEVEQVSTWFVNARKRNWYRHPVDPSQDSLSDERLPAEMLQHRRPLPVSPLIARAQRRASYTGVGGAAGAGATGEEGQEEDASADTPSSWTHVDSEEEEGDEMEEGRG